MATRARASRSARARAVRVRDRPRRRRRGPAAPAATPPPGAAGLDLRAAVDGELVLEPGARALVPTGLRIALPAGYEAQVRPRSGLALRHGIAAPERARARSTADYRGEIAGDPDERGARRRSSCSAAIASRSSWSRRSSQARTRARSRRSTRPSAGRAASGTPASRRRERAPSARRRPRKLSEPSVRRLASRCTRSRRRRRPLRRSAAAAICVLRLGHRRRAGPGRVVGDRSGPGFVLVAVIAIVLLGIREFYQLIEEKGAHPLWSFGLAAGAALPVVAYLGNEYHATILMTAVLLGGDGRAARQGADHRGAREHLGHLLRRLLRRLAAHPRGRAAQLPRASSSRSGARTRPSRLRPDVGRLPAGLHAHRRRALRRRRLLRGPRLGPRKLAPKISPGKTVEGALGGIVAGTVAGAAPARASSTCSGPTSRAVLPWALAAPLGAACSRRPGWSATWSSRCSSATLRRRTRARCCPAWAACSIASTRRCSRIPVMYYLMLGYHLSRRRLPMIDRYTRPEMHALWTDEARYRALAARRDSPSAKCCRARRDPRGAARDDPRARRLRRRRASPRSSARCATT